MFLYQNTIYKDCDKVIGLSAQMITDNNNAKSDFEENRKSMAVVISEMEISETVFISDKTYAEFSALIETPLTWENVRYIDYVDSYDLFLLIE
jgi:hypothetical protein